MQFCVLRLKQIWNPTLSKTWLSVACVTGMRNMAYFTCNPKDAYSDTWHVMKNEVNHNNLFPESQLLTYVWFAISLKKPHRFSAFYEETHHFTIPIQNSSFLVLFYSIEGLKISQKSFLSKKVKTIKTLVSNFHNICFCISTK